MPDEDRVFDVTKPKHVSPTATSKPVIVGHHPLASDPMVKDGDRPDTPTHIKVIEESKPDEPKEPSDQAAEPSAAPAPAAIFADPAAEQNAPAEPTTHPDLTPDPVMVEPAQHQDTPEEPAVFTEAPEAAAASSVDEAGDHSVVPPAEPQTMSPHIEELHFSDKNIKRSWWKPALLVLLLLLIAAYLAIDSGLIKTSLNLPFHIFKQKPAPAASSSSTPPPRSPSAVSQPAIPSGFKNYQLSGTNLTFAAPLAWGAPTSSVDPGYSKRGPGLQSDGTHAYLVNFATNKDVQVAVTSGKYLPASRPTQYYDYLQWCVGTNDGQYYEASLGYTTSAGVDTPSTVVCNQGPVANVTKLDAKTIVQAKAKDSSGATLGNIYTKNLTDPNLVVLRVKDAAMTNGDSIKQLLNTVQFSSTQ